MHAFIVRSEHPLNRSSARIADDEVVSHTEVVGLDRFERIHRCCLGLADHLDLRSGSHARSFRGLQGGVFGGVRPHGGAREDEFDLGRCHERLAIPPRESVHGVLIYLGEIVADRVHDGFIKRLELGSRLLGADIEWELLRAVEKQLDASQPRLLGLELEPPLDIGFCLGVGIGGEDVRYFSRHFIRRNAVASRPRLDDLDVVRG